MDNNVKLIYIKFLLKITYFNPLNFLFVCLGFAVKFCSTFVDYLLFILFSPITPFLLSFKF